MAPSGPPTARHLPPLVRRGRHGRAYDDGVSELPASVRLALWVTAAWHGGLTTTEALGRSFPDLDHVAGDLGRLEVWHDLGEGALFVALPRPGDVSGLPRTSADAAAHATEAGECVYVAGIGGLLVPTLSTFGPEGDLGHRIDWSVYEADPVPRHRLEMLDLRDTERRLMTRLAEHTARLAEVGGQPWGQEARAAAESDLDTRLWGVPRSTPARALRTMSLAGTAGQLADRALGLTALGSHGVDTLTMSTRDAALRSLTADADVALAEAVNVAVMTIAGWRPA
ncbi:MAG: hypothetical protein JWP82_1403 [Humibacillus sp.]|nr:hypothetical protein [Humibacillus sp.]